MAVTKGLEPLRYDEDAISDRVSAMPLTMRVLFACACAERLMPAYHWFCDRVRSDDFTVIRQALNAGWSAGRSDAALAAPPEIARWREKAEALVPSDDDEELLPGSAVAQNAVACVAYALRSWESADLQLSVWSARQVYEAADVVVQQCAGAHAYVEDVDVEAPVQLMLRGMDAVLHDLPTMDLELLRVRADADGQEFLGYMIGSD